MIAIVSALKSEMRPLLEQANILQKISIGRGGVYLAEDLHFLRTGLGPQQTSEIMKWYLNQFHPLQIWNIGLAGRLNLKIPIGTVYHISQLCMSGKETLLLNTAPGRTTRLLTVIKAVAAANRREKLFRQFSCSLVDMEAYIEASLSREAGIDFRCIKIVSDSADGKAKEDFTQRLPIFSEKLAKAVRLALGNAF